MSSAINWGLSHSLVGRGILDAQVILYHKITSLRAINIHFHPENTDIILFLRRVKDAAPYGMEQTQR